MKFLLFFRQQQRLVYPFPCKLIPFMRFTTQSSPDQPSPANPQHLRASDETETPDQFREPFRYQPSFFMSAITFLISFTVLGALLGTQNGREVEIVNTFELAIEGGAESVDHGFLVSRRDQCYSFFLDLFSRF